MKSIRIAVIGLGYVGLPLAVEFAKKYPVVGFDVKRERVGELREAHDATLEVSCEELQLVLCKSNHIAGDESSGLFVTAESSDLGAANCYIVTVPTPTDKNNLVAVIYAERDIFEQVLKTIFFFLTLLPSTVSYLSLFLILSDYI